MNEVRMSIEMIASCALLLVVIVVVGGGISFIITHFTDRRVTPASTPEGIRANGERVAGEAFEKALQHPDMTGLT